MTLTQPHCDFLYDGQSLWTGYVTFGMCQITQSITGKGSPVSNLDGSGSWFSSIICRICCSSEAEVRVPPNRP